ncbi:unnamed protein product [Rotaria sp. Silwood2]|nr:unnamed protein product [Rotaria sp. Silwood2]CAF2896175.1 unnamed protein product [Rotaria sp. Silwood2]CAF4227866.1 unnamed protein product [Rotaria sp. Silwood2]
MLAVASLKRSLEFDPVEQGVKRKRAEMKLSPPSSPISSSSSSTTTTFTTNTNPLSPSKQQQQQQSIFTSSPNKNQSLVFKKPCSLTALTSSTTTTTTDDIPMFTYTQAAQMCARLLREQDRSIREQYEQLLSNKLTEQYDTFVRYTHDSVHKDRTKQHHRLFHFGQQQETNNNNNNNTSTVAFSYVS